MSVGLSMIGGKTAGTAVMKSNIARVGSVLEHNAPEVGAVFYRTRNGGGHVGIVAQVNADGFITIEGNTSDSVAYRTHSFSESYTLLMPDYREYDPQNVIDVAKGQVGYEEGKGNDTPFGEFTGANGAAWCASFVSWCFDRAYPDGGDYVAYGDEAFSELSQWTANKRSLTGGTDGENKGSKYSSGGGSSSGGSSSGGGGTAGNPAYLAKEDDKPFEGQVWGNSELAIYIARLSNGSYFTRMNRAKHVTVHNAFADASIDELVSMVNSSGKAYNYAIDYRGVIGLLVDEQMWTNSCDNWQADMFGINIICSGGGGGFSEKTVEALTDLLEDVYRRNFIFLLTYNDNEDDTLTFHRMYNSGVDCPGAAAESQIKSIAEEVNNRLGAKISTNFVQVGSRLADSETAALRTQSLINVRQIRPYVIKVGKYVSSSAIDITQLYISGVVGGFVDIGRFDSELHYDSKFVYQVADALGQGLPFGYVFESVAGSIEELRREAYYLRFIISNRAPKLGIWLRPNFNYGYWPDFVDEWYAFFVDWGLKAKCGLYCTLNQASLIGWPRQATYMPLWLAGELSSVCPDDELLTPTFFKLDNLGNYGGSGSTSSTVQTNRGTGVTASGTTSSGATVYNGNLQVVQGPDGATVVTIPQVTNQSVAKKWESYTAITNKSTLNYQLTHSDKTTTDELGFRKYDDRYLIAVGSGVCAQPGTYMDVKLANGTVIPCIMGDGKADVHTDSNNIYTNVNSTLCCSEFIVDSSAAKAAGWGKTGDASNSHSGWDSPVVEITVYNQQVTTG